MNNETCDSQFGDLTAVWKQPIILTQHFRNTSESIFQFRNKHLAHSEQNRFLRQIISFISEHSIIFLGWCQCRSIEPPSCQCAVQASFKSFYKMWKLLVSREMKKQASKTQKEFHLFSHFLFSVFFNFWWHICITHTYLLLCGS